MSVEKLCARYGIFEQGFGDMVSGDLLLSFYEVAQRRLFVLAILGIMARTVGGISYFYGDLSREDAIAGWMDLLGDFSPYRILGGVEKILGGEYEKRGDVIPRTPIEFTVFIRKYTSLANRPEIKIAQKNVLEIGFDETSYKKKRQEKGIKNIREIMLQLGKQCARVRIHNNKGVLKDA